MDSNAFLVIAVLAIAAQSFLLFLALFEPGLAYKIRPGETAPLDSEDFLRVLEATTDARLSSGNRVEVFTNGENYYAAELEAVRAARESINLEAYIFQKGRVAGEFVAALAERARAGVEVRLVLDALGSFTTWDSYLRELTDAGGRVAWYNPLRWHSLARLNNRTHRELIVIDGRTGFIGGAGVADHWRYAPREDRTRWRDTMFCVRGGAAAHLQATFVENWLEASGEILADPKFFPAFEKGEGTPALVVNSSPTQGGSTRARILFQTLLASARESVLITTPYFLPDRSARAELVRAVERGVRVRIIVPGKGTDHALTRNSSRRLYGDLLRAGAQIYEYQPTMIHAKTLVVDDLWSVVGSTNFDNRSFGLNDEVNLAAFDRELAARVAEDFLRDLADSREISYEEWQRRSIFERVQELFGWLLERQQ